MFIVNGSIKKWDIHIPYTTKAEEWPQNRSAPDSRSTAVKILTNLLTQMDKPDMVVKMQKLEWNSFIMPIHLWNLILLLQVYPKLSQSYYALLECLASDHMGFISNLEPQVFLYILSTISDGLSAFGKCLLKTTMFGFINIYCSFFQSFYHGVVVCYALENKTVWWLVLQISNKVAIEKLFPLLTKIDLLTHSKRK